MLLSSPFDLHFLGAGVLSKFTTGGVHYFAEYDDARDGAVLESRIKHVVCRETGFEAVMRVRASTGLGHLQ